MPIVPPRRPTLSTLLSALLAAILASAGAAAATDDLYRCTTAVTGEREETRLPGFAACLPDVLVKVSGDPRLADDPRVAARAGEARGMVSGFSYRDQLEGIPHHDEQGTRDRPYDLTVSFDPARIDALLRELGRVPWTAPRPPLTILLAMRNLTTGYVVAADGDRALERDALAAAAERRGLRVVLADRETLAALGVTPGAGKPTALPPAAILPRIAEGSVALLGSLSWNDARSLWDAEWRLVDAARSASWTEGATTFDESFRRALGRAALVLSGNETPRPAP